MWITVSKSLLERMSFNLNLKNCPDLTVQCELKLCMFLENAMTNEIWNTSVLLTVMYIFTFIQTWNVIRSTCYLPTGLTQAAVLGTLRVRQHNKVEIHRDLLLVFKTNLLMWLCRKCFTQSFINRNKSVTLFRQSLEKRFDAQHMMLWQVCEGSTLSCTQSEAEPPSLLLLEVNETIKQPNLDCISHSLNTCSDALNFICLYGTYKLDCF